MDATTELNDPQLVVLVARYDPDALAEIYRRHGRSVYGLAKRVVGNEVEAEDVTQEVFLRLWHEPERFDPDRGSLRTYLLTQVHGRAVDVVRSQVARRRREEGEAAAERAAASYDLEREVWDLALADQIGRAVAGLPRDERTPIELAYFEGHTYRQVAEMLDQPEGTVKSRIRSGLRRMRSVLAEGGVRR